MEFDALKKIGYTLRFYRRLKGLSQLQMADALDVSVRNFQRLEMGAVEPKLETLTRIAQFLDIPVSALVRKTDSETLSLFPVSSSRERSEYRDLACKTLLNNQDLLLAKKLIKQDRLQLPNSDREARLEGTTATLSAEAAELLGKPERTLDIQASSLTGSPVERWELTFRYNLKQTVIENMYLCPKGIVVLQAYLHNLNPNPDNPTADIYVRDITARHNLENWIKSFRAVNAFS